LLSEEFLDKAHPAYIINLIMERIPIQHIRKLFAFSSAISSSLKIEDIREQAAMVVMDLLRCEASSLLLFDKEKEELYFDVALGEKGAEIKSLRLKLGQGIAGWVALNRQALIINDVQKDPRFYKGADELSGFITRNMVCVPVISKGRLLGVMQAINKIDLDFDEYDLELLSAVSAQVAVAIDNALLHEQLKHMFYEMTLALAETIERRDKYIGGHVKRVMEYSVAVAIEMGLDKDMVEIVKLAAILHDIGKICIKDAILFKESRLSEAESKIMQKHVTYGADILSNIKHIPKEVIWGVKYHHEHLDGSGYPEGLKGDEIPLVARIIAVPNVFDNMVAGRPYAPSLTVEAAINEIKGKSGIYYDPTVVESFFGVLERMGMLQTPSEGLGEGEIGKYI